MFPYGFLSKRETTCSLKFEIGLITVFDAILTGTQSGRKLQCLYGNPIANNFFQNWIFQNPRIALSNDPVFNNTLYDMASSPSGQHHPNRVLWLTTQAANMEPSCPLGTTRCIPQPKLPQKPYNKSFIDQVCSVKLAGYWPRSFFATLWTSTS